jgi:hypothetical protein
MVGKVRRLRPVACYAQHQLGGEGFPLISTVENDTYFNQAWTRVNKMFAPPDILILIWYFTTIWDRKTNINASFEPHITVQHPFLSFFYW